MESIYDHTAPWKCSLAEKAYCPTCNGKPSYDTYMATRGKQSIEEEKKRPQRGKQTPPDAEAGTDPVSLDTDKKSKKRSSIRTDPGEKDSSG